MPCYTIRLVTVEFRAENKAMLIAALKAVNVSYEDGGRTIRLGSGAIIDLDTKTIKAVQTSSNIDMINTIKRKYSELTIQKVCAVKKWFIAKSAGSNKLEIRRY